VITKYANVNTNESKHSEMGPVRQNTIQTWIFGHIPWSYADSEFRDPQIFDAELSKADTDIAFLVSRLPLSFFLMAATTEDSAWSFVAMDAV